MTDLLLNTTLFLALNDGCYVQLTGNVFDGESSEPF